MAKQKLKFIVAQNVRKFRKEKGWSQEELASRCGLHRTYIGAIERSERNITLETLERLSKTLKCTPQSLISNEQE